LRGGASVINSSGNPAFQAAAESAVRAVRRCAPYSLPFEKYAAWQNVIVNFDPREMLR
jgi:outer membrane biosynthesis protein TonB